MTATLSLNQLDSNSSANPFVDSLTNKNPSRQRDPMQKYTMTVSFIYFKNKLTITCFFQNFEINFVFIF